MNEAAGARAKFPQSFHALRQHAGHHVADQRSGGRRADLVGDDAQLAALAR